MEVGNILGIGHTHAETWRGEGTAYLQKGNKPLWLENSKGENTIQWGKKTILISDVSGVIDIFKDLLRAMHPLSRNMFIHSQFWKFTDFHKPAHELQSENSVWGTDVIRTGSLEEKTFWPKREVGNEWCLWDGGRQGVLTGQGFYQSHSSSINALNSQKSRWILGEGIFLCLCASWICLQC